MKPVTNLWYCRIVFYDRFEFHKVEVVITGRASGRLLPFVDHSILWVQPKVCVDPFPISWGLGEDGVSKDVYLVVSEIWAYALGLLSSSINPFLVSNIMIFIAQEAKTDSCDYLLQFQRNFCWLNDILLHERSCIEIIYCGKFKIYCV